MTTRAKIGEFQFDSWDEPSGGVEPASRQIAVLEAPPAVNGRAYVAGGMQCPFPGVIITGKDAGVTDALAEQLAQSYRNLKGDLAGVTVYNSVGKQFDNVMIVDVRCDVCWNAATGQWRVKARWQLDPDGDA